MAELTPVRQWIVNQLTALLPSDASEIRSDKDGALFSEWTDMSQQQLATIWIQEDTQRALNAISTVGAPNINSLRYQAGAQAAIDRAMYMIQRRQEEYQQSAQMISGTQRYNPASFVKLSVGTTTTCNAFLGVVVRKTRAVGGLAQRSFSSFDLPKAGGPAWNWYPTSGKSPQPGDFYQAGKRGGTYEHVGIILSVNGESIITADSGQGGPTAGYDAIKRVKRSGYSMMGWIDADEFFKSWKGPGSA